VTDMCVGITVKKKCNKCVEKTEHNTSKLQVIFNDHFIGNFLLNVPVKEVWYWSNFSHATQKN